MKYTAEKIVNGSLSVEQEQGFYAALESEMVHLIAKEHCFDLGKISRGDALRFITHLENLNCENYPKLKGANQKLVDGTRYGLMGKLNKAIAKMGDHPKSFLTMNF